MAYISKSRSQETDKLFEAILSLKDMEECYRFFDDVCTINEIRTIAQRLEVAKQLSEGKTFSVIAESTGASTTTISRVNRCLNYGSDGYKLILDKNESKD